MENAKESAKKGLNEVTSFYKGDFKDIIINFFKRPTDGMYSVFQKPSEKSLIHTIIIAVTVFLLFAIGSYIMAGGLRKFASFMDFVKIGLFPVLTMFLISGVSFIIKAVLGKANFKNELLTGAICGIPFIILFIVIVLLQLFTNNNAVAIATNPSNGGAVGMILLIYIFLMFINVVQQSLKSANVQDALAWYLSPASVVVSFYLSYMILF